MCGKNWFLCASKFSGSLISQENKTDQNWLFFQDMGYFDIDGYKLTTIFCSSRISTTLNFRKQSFPACIFSPMSDHNHQVVCVYHQCHDHQVHHVFHFGNHQVHCVYHCLIVVAEIFKFTESDKTWLDFFAPLILNKISTIENPNSTSTHVIRGVKGIGIIRNR